MAGPRILISAGEPSGDLHGAALARSLRRRWPDCRMYGLGGSLMAAAGVELVAHVERLAVMGFAEVLRDLPFFRRLLRDLTRSIAADPPDLVIPIDYPGFNMRLARAARSREVPVLYYIAPQVWAWHRSRLRKLARYTDRLAVILPFETELFTQAGARTTFVGHPLLDAEPPVGERASFASSLGLDPERPIVALFPGSRRQEVARHLELFCRAAALLAASRPEIQPVVAASGAVPAEAYGVAGLPTTLDAWSLLHHSRAALVKSGTGTLQAALARVPLVVLYRMHPLTYAAARRLVRVDHIALVNLVAGERLVPELVQEEATAEAAAAALHPFLNADSPERIRVLRGLDRVRSRLGAVGPGSAAERVAALAEELLGDRHA